MKTSKIFYKNSYFTTAKIYDTSFSKVKGLMFSSPLKKNESLLFVTEKENITELSIHSLFVFFSFDAVWLDKRCQIVDIQGNIKPFTLYRQPKRKAQYLLELPLGKSKRLALGNKLIVKFKSYSNVR